MSTNNISSLSSVIHCHALSNSSNQGANPGSHALYRTTDMHISIVSEAESAMQFKMNI